jgi:CRP/FNR family cyclic AMP-dependent transcriptional regulator
MNRSEIEQVLERCDLFRGLGQKEIAVIAGLCQIEHYEAGEAVFMQGDLGEKLYVIVQGQVFLERSTDLGGRKGNVRIGMLGKGRAMGCWSTLLDDAHHLMSSAVCHRATSLLSIQGPDLREIMVRDKNLGFNILERLCFVLRDRIHGAYGAMEKI